MRARFVMPAVGALVLALLVLVRVWDPDTLQTLRHRAFDGMQRLEPAPRVESPVTIVAIDEASLAAHGQWPWPRTLIADLVASLERAGAAAIAFDIVFAEPDRSSAENVVSSLRGLDPATEAGLRSLASNDLVLAETMAGARVVLGQPPVALRPADQGPAPTTVPKAAYESYGADPVPHLPRVGGWARNLPVLAEAAAGIGALSLQLDADGVVRRPALLVASDQGIFPAIALEALRVATSQATLVMLAGDNGLDTIRLKQLLVPTDRRGRVWVRFWPHRDDWFVAASAVLAGEVPVERVKGKVVFIGLGASGLQVVRPTPAGDLSTTEIEAQMAASMIARTLLVRPAWSDSAEFGAIVAAGALVIAGVSALGAMGGLACGVVAVAAVAGGSWLLFARLSLLLDPTYPAFATVALYLSLTVVGYVRERRQKQEVRGAFAQYLAPALVERLAENPASLKIGGEMKLMTVMFSDIRGFTGIAESLRHDPEGLTRLINLYFTAMSDRLLEYGATIDKYMGDAVMAFWNAPLDDPAHAANACRAGLEMLDGLAKLNRKLAASGSEVHIDIGIGINTGECLVGNIGSEHRFNYSVIGDSVNLASRIEGLCKTYGARILIGEATRRMAPGFAMIELDTIRVRGRAETTSVHALLGPTALVDDPAFAPLSLAQQGFLVAYRARDWAAADAGLDDLRAATALLDGHVALGAADFGKLCDLYDRRVAVLRDSPPGPEWDGVYPGAP